MIPSWYCHNQVVLSLTGRNSWWPPGVNLTHFVFLKLMISRTCRRLIMVRQTVIESNLPECPTPQSLFLHFLLDFWNSAAPLLLKNPKRDDEQRWVMVTIVSLMFLWILPWVFFCQVNIRLSECSHVWQTSQVIYCVRHRSMHFLTAFSILMDRLALQCSKSLTQLVEDTHI